MQPSHNVRPFTRELVPVIDVHSHINLYDLRQRLSRPAVAKFCVISSIIKKCHVSWRCANLLSLNTILYERQTALSVAVERFLVHVFFLFYNALVYIARRNEELTRKKLALSSAFKKCLNYGQRSRVRVINSLLMSKELHTYTKLLVII